MSHKILVNYIKLSHMYLVQLNSILKSQNIFEKLSSFSK